jgi:hypothetical protein
MLSDLAVAHAHDVDSLELNFATRRRRAQEFSPVGPVIGLVRCHAVAIGDLPMDVGVKVGKGGAQHPIQLSRARLVGCAAGLRRVVEKIIAEELFEHIEVPAALHFLGIAANDRLCRFARIANRHDLPHWIEVSVRQPFEFGSQSLSGRGIPESHANTGDPNGRA